MVWNEIKVFFDRDNGFFNFVFFCYQCFNVFVGVFKNFYFDQIKGEVELGVNVNQENFFVYFGKGEVEVYCECCFVYFFFFDW